MGVHNGIRMSFLALQREISAEGASSSPRDATSPTTTVPMFNL